MESAPELELEDMLLTAATVSDLLYYSLEQMAS